MTQGKISDEEVKKYNLIRVIKAFYRLISNETKGCFFCLSISTQEKYINIQGVRKNFIKNDLESQWSFSHGVEIFQRWWSFSHYDEFFLLTTEKI